jgi:hypothetical protein
MRDGMKQLKQKKEKKVRKTREIITLCYTFY